MENKKVHEPLLRMAKRAEGLPSWKAWGIRVIAFLLSLVVYAASRTYHIPYCYHTI